VPKISAMAALPAAQSLRILSIDGGGIKGYSALLILRRIFRSLVSEGNLDNEPRPCEVFDLIAGTSTGGLIAVMLGRLHMTVDECIAAYEEVGKKIFSSGPAGGQVGKLVKGLTSSPFHDIEKLQEEVRKVLDEKGIPRNESFLEVQPTCKV
jgi:patatin-like phospholipase/acyl hydrolase